MAKLDGKIALVTGASRGIGREIAFAFAREGADVAANYNKRQDMADSLVTGIEELGQKAVAIQGDVGKPEDIERMVEQAMAAIVSFTRVLAQEVSRQGVYANCIAPGPIATEIVPVTGPRDPEADAQF